MKRKIGKILISILGILFLISVEAYSNISGYVISISECKESNWGDEYEECIVCKYESNSLRIKHLKALYNCCFEDLKGKIDIENNKIVIESRENYGGKGPCD